jgi:aconitate hydratase
MGVLPLQFEDGEDAGSHGLTGSEVYAIGGIAEALEAPRADRFVTVRAVAGDDSSEAGEAKEFRARVRLDTPQEVEYYRHGGILQYVLRQMVGG